MNIYSTLWKFVQLSNQYVSLIITIGLTGWRDIFVGNSGKRREKNVRKEQFTFANKYWWEKCKYLRARKMFCFHGTIPIRLFSKLDSNFDNWQTDRIELILETSFDLLRLIVLSNPSLLKQTELPHDLPTALTTVDCFLIRFARLAMRKFNRTTLRPDRRSHRLFNQHKS